MANKGNSHEECSENGAELSSASEYANSEIAPEEWPAFFNTFSRQHEGWLGSVVVSHGPEKLTLVRERPLDVVEADHRDREPQIYISVSNDTGEQLTHPILHPVRVVTRNDEAGEGFDITCADQSVTMARFQRVTPAGRD